MSGDGLASSQDRRVLIAVLAKVSFYYAALFSLVFALLTVFPNLITMLPVGASISCPRVPNWKSCSSRTPCSAVTSMRRLRTPIRR